MKIGVQEYTYVQHILMPNGLMGPIPLYYTNTPPQARAYRLYAQSLLQINTIQGPLIDSLLKILA